MKTIIKKPFYQGIFCLLLASIAIACSNDEKPLLQDEEILSSFEETNASIDQKVATTNSVCKKSGTNTSREYTPAYPNNNSAVNIKVDDRTCTYNFENQGSYGVYKLKANSNHMDNLQPRIERASKVVTNVKSGNNVQLKGTLKIIRAGHKSSNIARDQVNNPSGTYFMQAKGKHANADGSTPNGSSDPAVCLFLAKPRFSGSTQTSFDIYREEITVRGGSGTNGRRLVFLKNVPANTDIPIEMITGFHKANSSSPLVHYVNVKIDGTSYNWQVPTPSTIIPLQAKYRMGAYRCKGGEAEIQWKNVTTKFTNN
ncbi:hypothetical protein BWZ22_07520 [Seonamhaeicola sp. S2-3]|uniref:hypothetical protein n=1 Tax=Seonamhaeicola sp. S2-3 TaxID=1936081 RepID=UPI000972DD63|nr:hypothetical protein [Seonamhaeicola sp. S2-3]APY11099.1 hypothetical protein BWZ22_07520 [Seonamhaeicola sp. S2-3]